jgi:fructuronate reductase
MTRLRLSEATLTQVRPGAARPGYGREACRIGWVHFGPGAFHRAHQAYYADRLLERDPRWAISAVSLRSAATREALSGQDYLYCLAELGGDLTVRIIGALREILVAPADCAAALARLESPETRIVTLTVTEKGYCLGPDGQLDARHPDIVHDLGSAAPARSVIGFLAAALGRRRAHGHAPFAVVSCDNLPDNGPTLRAAVAAFAARRDRSFARWIESEVAFPRTMVDSITPATDAELIERVAEASGLEDAWPVQRERFTQWVIEDLPAMRVADWASVGVTLAADVAVYDRAKLRLVNGAHSTLAYIGLLRGRSTVAEAMRDAPLARFCERLMREDIAPSLHGPGRLELSGYIDATLARLRNPGVRHQLAQIAWDGSKKLPVRLLSTLAEALAAGRPIERLALPIAAWMRFIVGRARTGEPLSDPAAVRLLGLGRACTGEPESDVARFLTLEDTFGARLVAAPAFERALVNAYRALGPGGAIPAALGGGT